MFLKGGFLSPSEVYVMFIFKKICPGGPYHPSVSDFKHVFFASLGNVQVCVPICQLQRYPCIFNLFTVSPPAYFIILFSSPPECSCLFFLAPCCFACTSFCSFYLFIIIIYNICLFFFFLFVFLVTYKVDTNRRDWKTN